MKPFEVRWRNFRGFQDTGWLSIRPLTILIGPNNSGKSSLLTPLLLLKQTLDEARDPSIGLLTSGRLVEAGAYRDLVFRRDQRRRVSFSIRFRRARADEKRRRIGADPPGAAEFVFGPSPEGVVLERFLVSDVWGRQVLARRLLASGKYGLTGLARSAKGLVSRRRSLAKIRSDPYLQEFRRSQPKNFLFDSSEAVSTVLEGLPGESPTPEKAIQILSPQTLIYLAVTGSVDTHISELLEEIGYVGPLRERPQRNYPLSGEIPPDVGTKGEFAPEVLFRSARAPLVKQVEKWLANFGFPQVITCEAIGDSVFTLGLRSSESGPSVNIADSGFGVSQVLPLIVQGLYSAEGSLLIAEQPEIHLNPRLQAILGDFFAEMAVSNRAVLVETHSEHLLLRIRRLIAEGSLKNDQVALYFVEKASNVGPSTVRRIPIREDGYVSAREWPRGFFADSLREATALASSQLRRKG